ncbi:MAG: hypothetical protein ACPGWR_20855 [Ardenticatenaceae bacterium]
MGITINYDGTLDDPSRIDQFIYDMKLRCRKLKWPCNEVNERIIGDAYYYMGDQDSEGGDPVLSMMEVLIGQKSVDDRIRGVHIEPPGTEMLSLTFNRKGDLMEYTPLPGQMTSESTPLGNAMGYTHEPGYYLESPVNWVKTTGEVSSHVLIVGLLRYIEENYISDLEVEDDTDFWEDLDLKQLQWQHGRMKALLNYIRQPENIKSILKSAGIEGVEDIEHITTITPEELNFRPKTPEHMKGWGMSAYEN